MTPNEFIAHMGMLDERLSALYLNEADPQLWPADGVEPMQQTRDERGDRVWCKKNADHTLSLLLKSVTFQTRMIDLQLRKKALERGTAIGALPDEDPDATLKRVQKNAERMAKKMIAKMTSVPAED